MLQLYCPYGSIAAVLSTDSEAKHFSGISLVSIAVIVIPVRENRS